MMEYREQSGTPISVHTGTIPVPQSGDATAADGAGHIQFSNGIGRKPFDLKILLYVVIAMVFIGGVVFSHFQQLQVKTDYMNLQAEYDLEQSENIRLQSVIAGKTSNKNIQEYAENVLGMQELNASQIEYVQIQTSDVIILPEEEENLFVRIKEWFRSLVEYFRG